MAVYSMLTDTGLSEINNSQSGNILIEAAYWMACFDQRIEDDYEAGNPDYQNIANYTTPSDVVPTADVYYWNSLASSATPITEPDVSDLYTGVTYQPVIKDDALQLGAENGGEWDAGWGVYPNTASEGDYWVIKDINSGGKGIIEGVFYGIGDRMVFNGSTFKNGCGSETQNYRGNFKVIISDSRRDMIINKIALYGIKRDLAGTIIGDPFLLGQVIIPNKQLVQPFSGSDSTSVDQLIVDFQIDTQAVIADFDNVFFSSQNDYWQRVTNNDGQYGLLYDGQVFITNKLGIDDQSSSFPKQDDVGVAKALISTYESVNKPNSSEEKELPQLVLQYVADKSYPAGLNNAFAPRIRTTMRTNDSGDFELNLYGACSNEFGYYSVIPKQDRVFGLGNNNNRWHSIKTSDRVEMYLGEEYDYVNTDDDNGIFANYNFVNVSGYNLVEGDSVAVYQIINNQDGSTTVQFIKTDSDTSSIGKITENIPEGGTGNIKIRRDARWDFVKQGNTSNSYGYVVLRENDMSNNKNLGLAYFGNTSIEVGPHFDSRDIKQGNGFTYMDWKDNYYYVYGNISNYMPGATDLLTGQTTYRPYPLNIRSTGDIALYTLAQDYVSKYEKESLNNTTWNADSVSVVNEIYSMIEMGKNRLTSNFVKKFTGRDGTPTIYDNFYTPSTWNDIKSNLVGLEDVRESLFGSQYPSGQPTGGETIKKDMLIASSRYIYTFGDIVPMVDGLNNIGGYEHGFDRIYVAEIYGMGRTSSDNYPILSVRGDIYPSTTGTKIGRDNRIDNNEGPRWRELNADMVGNSGDWIDNGYITTLQTKDIVAESLSMGTDLKITEHLISGNDLIIGDPNDLSKVKFYGQVQLDFSSRYKTLYIDIGNNSTSRSSCVETISVPSTAQVKAEIKYSIVGVSEIVLSLTQSITLTYDFGGDCNKSSGSGSGTINGIVAGVRDAIANDAELSTVPVDWSILSSNVKTHDSFKVGDFTLNNSMSFNDSFTTDSLTVSMDNGKWDSNNTSDFNQSYRGHKDMNGYIATIGGAVQTSSSGSSISNPWWGIGGFPII